MRRVRFTPQLPRTRETHADPSAQAAFKKEGWPAAVTAVKVAYSTAQIDLWVEDEHLLGLLFVI
jgi:hypothetical protein